MLRLNCLYSKEWQKRYCELIERGLTLEAFYVDLCECKATGMFFYYGKPIDEVLKTTEEVINYNRRQIDEFTKMTLIEKMRYKG